MNFEVSLKKDNTIKITVIKGEKYKDILVKMMQSANENNYDVRELSSRVNFTTRSTIRQIAVVHETERFIKFYKSCKTK